MYQKKYISKCLYLFFLIGIIFVAFSSLSHAGNYYVSPTGNAVWSSCTSTATPCSWQTAMANAVADDIVYFRGGTYSVEASCSGTWELPAMIPAHGGTLGHPITFIAYSGETPIITPCAASTISPAFGARDVDYIIWDGFSGTHRNNSNNSEVWYFVYWNSNRSIVRNMNFGAVGGNTTYRNNSPIRIENCSYAEVYNNYLHDNTGNSVATNTAGIWIFGSQYSKIYNNTITNTAHGIMQKNFTDIQNEIYKNLIYNTSNYGIALGENSINQPGGNMVYQNVLINTLGIYIGAGGGQNHNNVKIYNNTLYNNSSSNGIYLDVGVINPSVFNNIFYNHGNPFTRYDAGDFPLYSNYNDFYSTSAHYWNIGWVNQCSSLATWQSYATGLDANSITTNPNFVNAGGITAADYKRTSYPTNGMGGAYASVMGAYITGNERIGYLPRATNFR